MYVFLIIFNFFKEYFTTQLTSPEKVEAYILETKETCDKQDLVAQVVCERIEALHKSKDLSGLSTFLTILQKDPIVLAVFFVHVDPVQLLGPVRVFIDEFEMTSDYGILFLQIIYLIRRKHKTDIYIY